MQTVPCWILFKYRAQPFVTHSKYNLRAAAVIDVVFVDICRGTITQKYFHSITEKS